jgi:hypothetical protein
MASYTKLSSRAPNCIRSYWGPTTYLSDISRLNADTTPAQGVDVVVDIIIIIIICNYV